MSDEGRTDLEIAEQVGLCERQIVRIRQKFVKAGVQPTLVRATRKDAGVPRSIDGAAEAQLITIACGTPPEGREHWTLELLCGERKRLKVVKSACCETVRQVLKKTNCALGRASASASPRQTEPAASRGWKKSSTPARQRTTKNTR